MQTLKVSRLTFSVKETPYSAYVTICKKFIPNSELLPSALSDLNPISSLKFRELEAENRKLCDTIDILKKTSWGWAVPSSGQGRMRLVELQIGFDLEFGNKISQ